MLDFRIYGIDGDSYSYFTTEDGTEDFVIHLSNMQEYACGFLECEIEHKIKEGFYHNDVVKAKGYYQDHFILKADLAEGAYLDDGKDGICEIYNWDDLEVIGNCHEFKNQKRVDKN